MDAHTYRMDLHEILWAVTQFRGHPVSGCLGRPKIGSPSRIYGPPHHCRWSPTFCGWTLTLMFGRPRGIVDAQEASSWTPTNCCGYPRDVMGCHVIVWMPTRNFGRPSRNNVSVHKMLWVAIRKSWRRILLCGHPDYASGVPRLCVGVRGMCVDCHAFMWASSILLVGSHETNVAGHGKNVESHAFSWTTTTS